MNFRELNDFRDKRNQFINMPYSQMHYSIASYCTDSSKDEMKATFGDDFLNNLPMIPDPLRKNLADTLITAQVSKKVKTKSFLEEEIMAATIEHPKIQNNTDRTESHTFSSITSFISGVFNVLSNAMFRSKPEDQHYDFNYTNEQQRAPEHWQPPKFEDQNINERAHEQNVEKEIKAMEINNEYRTTVTSCEAKLNQVRNLLNTKPVNNVRRFRPRRPKKQFVDVGAYEEQHEDAFTEDVSNLADDPLVEYICPSTCHCCEYLEIDGPITRTYIAPQDVETSTHIEETSNECDTTQLDNKNCKNEPLSEKNCNLITTCEDKLSRLKALLQQKKTIAPTSELICETESKLPVSKPNHSQKPTPCTKIHDKHYKNHHRTTNKRQKANLHRAIQEDLLFANEIDADSWSSLENSPPVLTEVAHLSETPLSDQTDYFDEVKGRFRNSSTTESDDSFQIVFAEPQPARTRKISECDSEDSFIVFDDSPESCYTSTDVFGEIPSEIESDYSDSDSDISDSGCGVSNLRCNKLSPYLSRTISDLTDDSLYEDSPKDVDQVDCSFKTAIELPSQAIVEAEAMEKKKCKKVHFSPLPPKVHVMRVWAFAARQARAGHWERHTLDRDRFKRRIADVEMAVSWVLKPQHRSRVIFQRFMPWWNAQKRLELAEKKEEERRKQAQIEEDAIKKEEEERQVEKERPDEQVEEKKDLEVNEEENHSEVVLNQIHTNDKKLANGEILHFDKIHTANDKKSDTSKEKDVNNENFDVDFEEKNVEKNNDESKTSNVETVILNDVHMKTTRTENINTKDTANKQSLNDTQILEKNNTDSIKTDSKPSDIKKNGMVTKVFNNVDSKNLNKINNNSQDIKNIGDKSADLRLSV